MTQTLTSPAPEVRQHRLTGHRLKSIRVTGGFLDGVSLDLADGLNCLIGARGTGKTTVLELVRYALDALPAGDDGHRIESLIRTNLGDGTVELVIETREGLVYKVIRAWREDPVVLTEDGGATETSLRSGSVFRADIHSQNEIERMADQSLSQLSLIDNFECDQIAGIVSELRTLASRLSTNATTLIPLRDRIAALNDEIAGLPGIEQKLKALGPIVGRNAEAVTQAQQAKSLRQREKQAMAGLRQFLHEYNQAIQTQQGQVASRTAQWLGRELLAGPNGDAIARARQAMLDGAAEIDELLRQACSNLALMQAALVDVQTKMGGTHAQQEAAYQKLVAKDGELRGQAAERSNLERMRNDLLAKRSERDTLVEKETVLRKERAQLLHRLSELRDRRYAVRTAVARRINTALMPTIRVTIEQTGHLSQYRELLEDALRGYGMKHGVVAQRIAERISPTELVALIRRGDSESLVQCGEINDTQAGKVLVALKDSEALFTLETVELADKPRIELRDGDSYKPSSSLSTGQKCTTILPILLLDSDNPLLIDQPEDNLDNRFVCESVVESIRKVKPQRQLMFVTHNPNIPVLADAEQVFVLDSNGTRARIATKGDVDECRDAIVNLLEGGEQAFKQRQERYAY